MTLASIAYFFQFGMVTSMPSRTGLRNIKPLCCQGLPHESFNIVEHDVRHRSGVSRCEGDSHSMH